MFSGLIRRLLCQEEGSGHVEYAVMIGVGVLVIGFAVNSLSSSVNDSLNQASGKLENALNSRGAVDKEGASYQSRNHRRSN